MLKLPQGTEKNVIFDVIRRRYVALTLKNGCGSTSSTFFLLTRVSAGACGNEVRYS